MEVTVVIVTLSAQTPLVHIPVPAQKVIMEMAYRVKRVCSRQIVSKQYYNSVETKMDSLSVSSMSQVTSHIYNYYEKYKYSARSDWSKI